MNKQTNNYPVLHADSLDYRESIVYSVTACIQNKEFVVTHRLTGDSIILKLIKNQLALFSSTLKYKKNAMRTHSDVFEIIYENETSITANNRIKPIYEFEKPEIWPSVVIVEKYDPFTNGFNYNSMKLNDFWKKRKFLFPKKARLATHNKLIFETRALSSLISRKLDVEMKPGSIKVAVNYFDITGSYPIKVICAKDVYKEISRVTSKQNIKCTTYDEAFRASIITTVLTSAYYQLKLKKLCDKEFNPKGRLETHLQVLEQLGHNWWDENFQPDIAASSMYGFFANPKNK